MKGVLLIPSAAAGVFLLPFFLAVVFPGRVPAEAVELFKVAAYPLACVFSAAFGVDLLQRLKG